MTSLILLWQSEEDKVRAKVEMEAYLTTQGGDVGSASPEGEAQPGSDGADEVIELGDSESDSNDSQDAECQDAELALDSEATRGEPVMLD